MYFMHVKIQHQYSITDEQKCLDQYTCQENICDLRNYFLPIMDGHIFLRQVGDIVTSPIIHCKLPCEQVSTASVLSTLL